MDFLLANVPKERVASWVKGNCQGRSLNIEQSPD
jgi:hypothetical protein